MAKKNNDFFVKKKDWSTVKDEFEGYARFFNDCANTVIGFCNEHNISYHIKDGTITQPSKTNKE